MQAEGAGGKADSSSVSAPARSQPAVVDDDALATARRFLATRNQIDGLSFREARGYWANTYVPGDRTLRQYRSLTGKDLTRIKAGKQLKRGRRRQAPC